LIPLPQDSPFCLDRWQSASDSLFVYPQTMNRVISRSLALFTLLCWSGFCASPSADKPMQKTPKKVYPTFGAIERNDPKLDQLLAPDAKIERLAGGFTWAEGPVWV